MCDGSNKAFEPAIVSTKVKDLLENGAIFPFESCVSVAAGTISGRSSTLTMKPAIGIGFSAGVLGTPRCSPLSETAYPRPGSAALGHFRDHSNLRVVLPCRGIRKIMLVVAGVQRQRDWHSGKTTVSSKEISVSFVKATICKVEDVNY